MPDLAQQVIDQVNAVEDELAIDPQLTSAQQELIHMIGKDVDEAYYENVLSIQLNPDVNRDLVEIVFSPEHGTANIPVREVFTRAGYHFTPVEEQCTPDPDFSCTKTPNPEEKGAYELALKLAEEKRPISFWSATRMPTGWASACCTRVSMCCSAATRVVPF